MALRCFSRTRPAPWDRRLAVHTEGFISISSRDYVTSAASSSVQSSSSTSKPRKAKHQLDFKDVREFANRNEWRRALNLARSLLAPDVDTKAEQRDGACRAVTSVLHALAQVRPPDAWKHALELIEQLDSAFDGDTADIVTYNVLLSVLAKSDGGCPISVLDTMRSKSVVPDEISYNTTLTALGQKSWKDALAFFPRIESPRLPTYNAMLRAFGAEWRPALAFMDSIPVTPDVMTYSAMLHVYARSGEWARAISLLDSMTVPNTVCLNSAIHACVADGRWEEALQLVHRATNSDAMLPPDAVTFGAAINACDKAGQWQAALRVLNSMPARAVEPNSIVYGAAISACAHRDKWEQAVILFGRHSGNVKPTTVTYTALINALAKDGQWDRSLRLLKQMEYTNVPRNLIVYNAALSACAEGVKWAKAVKLLHEMTHNKVPPDVISFTTAISACEKVNMWTAALRLLERMNHHQVVPNALTYACVLRSLSFSARKAQKDGIILQVQEIADRWAQEGGLDALSRGAGAAPTRKEFISCPLDAITLLEAFGDLAPKVFAEHVRSWVFDHVVKALRHGDVETLQKLALPTLGPLTREVLDFLDMPAFDATDARKKVAPNPKEKRRRREVRAFQVKAHVKSDSGDRVVKYGSHSLSKVLPSVYIEHDRSSHAERQALLATQRATGVVELYVSHRPCVSCIAAMAAFQSPTVQLKVTFDE